MDTEPIPQPLNPDRWVEDHGDYLFGLARFRVRNESAAEDLVQETLLSAYRARERFEGRSGERTWLTAILKNKIRDYFRKKGREVPVSELMPDDPSPADLFDRVNHVNAEHAPEDWGTDPVRSADRSDLRKTLQKCLNGLPDRSAEVFLASEVEGESTDEIANRFGITRNHLWVLMHRTRLMLRQCLERNWFAA